MPALPHVGGDLLLRQAHRTEDHGLPGGGGDLAELRGLGERCEPPQRAEHGEVRGELVGDMAGGVVGVDQDLAQHRDGDGFGAAHRHQRCAGGELGPEGGPGDELANPGRDDRDHQHRDEDGQHPAPRS